VAIDPRPDPEELSHAPTSQVPRIHDSCHSYTFQDDANATRSDRRSNRLRRSQNEQLSAQPSEQPVAPTVAA